MSKNKKLQELSETDPLTGLANRRYYEKELNKQVAMSKRNRVELSLLLIDIDFFKEYNDHYGHEQGDMTLKAVASVIKDSLLRSTDLAARYGGEEFIVLLPSTDGVGTIHVANRSMDNLLDKAIEHKYSKVSDYVTVSIGTAKISDEVGDPDVLFKNADAALYHAKDNGRNRAIQFCEINGNLSELTS